MGDVTRVCGGVTPCSQGPLSASSSRCWEAASLLKPCAPILRPNPSPSSMTTTAWITMIAVMTFVWGGFALVVRTAVRKESGKTRN